MVSADSEIDDVLSIVSESGYSRLPVYGSSREDLLGIVHVKDVLEFWTRRRLSNVRRRAVEPFDLEKILRKVPFVPETKPVLQLLNDLRSQRAHVAFVVDEFGTITGLVSMEDVIEQVFGEIEDEFDQHIPRPSLTADSIDVAGTIPIRDLDTQYGIVLPTDLEFETLAGFLLYKFGRIPRESDVCMFEGRNYSITKMDFNRIVSVRIDRMPEEPSPPATVSDTTA
jgi:CBS domain containing-hemolysin-like protein